jgi:hypothetical protein
MGTFEYEYVSKVPYRLVFANDSEAILLILGRLLRRSFYQRQVLRLLQLVVSQ